MKRETGKSTKREERERLTRMVKSEVGEPLPQGGHHQIAQLWEQPFSFSLIKEPAEFIFKRALIKEISEREGQSAP